MNRMRRRTVPIASLGLAVSLLGAGVSPAAAAPDGPSLSAGATASSSAIGTPTSSGTTAYVKGASISWLAENVPVANGPWPGTTAMSGSLAGVAGGRPGLVIVGTDSTAGLSAGRNAASWVSADGGVSWSEHVLPEAGNGFFDLAAHGGVFVAIAPTGFWYSTDGATWTRSTSGPPVVSGAAVAPGLEGFVAVTRTGGRTLAWTSIDGIEWHGPAVAAALQGLCAVQIAASPTRAVLSAFGCTRPFGNYLAVSTNGRTWARVAPPVGMATPFPAPTVSRAGSRFIMFGWYRSSTRFGTAVWASTTGVTWTRTSFLRARTVEPDLVGSVVRFGGGWAAVGSYGLGDADDCFPVIWSTPDLVHWSRNRLPDAPWSGTCSAARAAASSQGRLAVVGRAWAIDYDTTIAWIGTLVP